MSADGSLNNTESEEHDELEDESDSDSMDEEIKLNQNFINVLQKISSDSKTYDDYALLLDIAHDLKDLDKIRQSLEIFAAEYPLSPALWMRYLKTEVSLAQTDEEIKKIQKMFQRALNDYYSIEVALEYSKLAEKSSDEVAREVWEDLLPAYGYEYTKGRLMWAAWRKDFMRRENDSPDKLKRIIKKYKEELLLPLDGMEITFNELQEFIKTHNCADQVNLSSIEDEVKNTKKILVKVAPFEKHLAKLEEKSHHERVDTFKKYIETCSEELEEEYVQVLYERMITACCLNESVWIMYLNYIKNRPKDWSPLESNKSKIFLQNELDVINRALRNCDWSATLYVEKIQQLELCKASSEDIKKVLEKASSVPHNTAEPVVKVWIEYLSYLTRVTNFDDEKQRDILRKTFDLSWNTLGWQFGDLADCECEILKFWGIVEYSKLKDYEQGKQLWNTVMGSNENCKKIALWIEYAQLENQYSGAEAARVIFKRAIKVQDIDDLYSLASYWTRFERCNGSLQQLKVCQEACESALARRKTRDRARGNLVKKPHQQTNKRKADDEEGPHERKKQAVSSTKDDFQKLRISKAPERMQQPEHHDEIDTSKDSVRIFISNIDYKTTVDDLREGFPEISFVNFEMIMNKLGKSLGYGYAELESNADVEKALKLDRRLLANRPVFISRCERDKNRRQGFKFSTKLEPNKIFIRGLAYSATDEDLRDHFKEFGTIKDIRIVLKRNGQSKGCAYIEFEEEKAAKTAVFKMNDKEILGRALQVAISAPPERDEKREQSESHQMHASNQQPPRRTGPRNEQKSRLSFVPVSVQKATVSKEGNGTAPKSNSDFRKMFMK